MTASEALLAFGYKRAASKAELEKWQKSPKLSAKGYVQTIQKARYEYEMNRAVINGNKVSFYKAGPNGSYDYVRLKADAITGKVIKEAINYKSGQPLSDTLQEIVV